MKEKGMLPKEFDTVAVTVFLKNWDDKMSEEFQMVFERVVENEIKDCVKGD